MRALEREYTRDIGNKGVPLEELVAMARGNGFPIKRHFLLRRNGEKRARERETECRPCPDESRVNAY